jgi:hypothetical protein
MSIKFPASVFVFLIFIFTVVVVIVVVVIIAVVIVDIVIETYSSTFIPIAIVVGRTPLLGHPGKPLPSPIRSRTGTPPNVHIQIAVRKPLPTSDLVLDLGPDPILATLLPLSLLSPRLDVPPPTPSTLSEHALGSRPLTFPTRRRLRGVDVPEVAFRLVATTV